MINTHDIIETINMIDNENLDVRLMMILTRPVQKFMIKSADMLRIW